MQGLQVMSPHKCRAGDGLTPTLTRCTQPVAHWTERVWEGEAGEGGTRLMGPPTKGRGKERIFHKPFPLIASAYFQKGTTLLGKKNKSWDLNRS